MAGRERGTSQDVPNDLLAQMVAALQQMSENLQNLNRSVAPGPSSHPLVQQGPTEYRGLDKSCRRNPSPFQGGFALNAAIEWVQGMGCTNMKADGVATSESIPHKDFGPQRNFVHGRGKDKMYHEERKPYFPPIGTRSCTSHGPRTHANIGGSRLNSPSWCSKCNRKHDRGLCSGTTNHFFRCKETGHIKRHCPMSRQSVNAMGTVRPQSIGRMVITYGEDASEVDGLTRCRMYEEKANESQRSYTLTGVHRNHGDQGSKPTVGGFQPDVLPMCSKCGRKHVGTICPGSGNSCFQCKEKGHIRRFCPRLTQKVNVLEVRRPSTTGQVSTVSGTNTIDIDGFIRGNRIVTVLTRLWRLGICTRSLTRLVNLYYSVDMRDDVPAGFNPGIGLADIGNAQYRGGVPQLSALNVVPAKVVVVS
ncbi:hypothetical protein Lal_00017058 [Lupinus albus]|nr:hypothetical protein Lal_00017058 [Lupinus albus]